MGHPAVSVSVC